MNGPHKSVRPVHFSRHLDNWKRAEVAQFGWKQAGDVDAAYRQVAKMANAMYDIGSEEKNVRAWLRNYPSKKGAKARS